MQVFQRRQDGSVDFYRDWETYKEGFGNLTSEFWLGNEKIHQLTSQRAYELRIDLADWEGNTRYAVYDSFSIADESDYYRLTLGSYNGTAGNNIQFLVFLHIKFQYLCVCNQRVWFDPSAYTPRQGVCIKCAVCVYYWGGGGVCVCVCLWRE